MTPIRPTVTMSDAVLGVRSHPGSFSSAGSTTPSTTRSKPSSATASQQSGATHPADRPTAGAAAERSSIVVLPHRVTRARRDAVPRPVAGKRGSPPSDGNGSVRKYRLLREGRRPATRGTRRDLRTLTWASGVHHRGPHGPTSHLEEMTMPSNNPAFG